VIGCESLHSIGSAHCPLAKSKLQGFSLSTRIGQESDRSKKCSAPVDTGEPAALALQQPSKAPTPIHPILIALVLALARTAAEASAKERSQ
jgi:hypothetical protein